MTKLLSLVIFYFGLLLRHPERSEAESKDPTE